MSFVWSPAILFMTCFVTLFATVIAVTKDLPDVEGDRRYGIKTFATWLGVERMSWGAIFLLLSNYVVAVALAITMPNTFNRSVMGPAHVFFAAYLIRSGVKLSQRQYEKRAIQSFYRSIWNLFYMEYMLLPFI